jgi:hypothetical protein
MSRTKSILVAAVLALATMGAAPRVAALPVPDDPPHVRGIIDVDGFRRALCAGLVDDTEPQGLLTLIRKKECPTPIQPTAKPHPRPLLKEQRGTAKRP